MPGADPRAGARRRFDGERLAAARDAGLQRLHTTTRATGIAAVALAGALAAFVAANAPGRKATAAPRLPTARLRSADDSSVAPRRHHKRTTAQAQPAPAPPPVAPAPTEAPPVIVSGGS